MDNTTKERLFQQFMENAKSRLHHVGDIAYYLSPVYLVLYGVEQLENGYLVVKVLTDEEVPVQTNDTIEGAIRYIVGL